MRLLREQLAQLNRINLNRNDPRERRRDYDDDDDRRLSSEIRRNRSYEDMIRQKLNHMNDQLQRSLNQFDQRNQSDDNHGHDRDFKELKDKVDNIMKELQRMKEYSFNSREIPITSQRGQYSKSRESLPVFADSKESLPTFLKSQEAPTELKDEFRSSRIERQEPLVSPEVQPNLLLSRQSYPMYLTVCPICMGSGHHKHGDYTFHGEPVHVIQGNVTRDHVMSNPVQSSFVSLPINAANIVTSTPSR